MIKLLEKAREILRGVQRRTRDLCMSRRIPFYDRISRIPTHMTMDEREFLYNSARGLPSGNVIAERGLWG